MLNKRRYVIGAYDEATVTYRYYTGIWFKDDINEATLFDAQHIDEAVRKVYNRMGGKLTLGISKVFTDKNHKKKRLTKMNHYELLSAMVHNL